MAAESDIKAAGVDLRAVAKSVAARKKGAALLAADYAKLVKANATIGSADVLLALAGTGSVSPAPPSTAPTPEVLPPTVPVRLIATPGVDQIVYSWGQCADKHDGTNVATGVVSHTLNIDGVDHVVTTASSPAVVANIRARPTFLQNGVSGASLTQSGNSDTIVSTGTGLETTDAYANAYWDVTGPFCIQVRIASLTGPVTLPAYAWAGLMVRQLDSPANTAKYVSFGQYLSKMNKGLPQQQRDVPGGAFSQLADAVGNGAPVTIQIERDAANLVSYHYKFDGGNWQTLVTHYPAFTDAVRISAFVSAYHATDALTAVFEDLCYTTGSRLTYTHSITAPATCVAKVRATDTVPNTSAWSASVTASPQVSAPGGGTNIKWHPGHGLEYAYTDGGQSVANGKANFDQMRTNNVLAWGHWITYWSKIEATQGVYDFSHLQEIRDYLNNTAIPGRFNTPKRMGIEIGWQSYGRTYPGSGTHPVPQYIIDNGWTRWQEDYPGATTGAWTADWRNAGARTAYKAMITALAAWADADPWIELIAFGETAFELDGGAGNEDILAHMKSVFPRTNVCVQHNWLGLPKPNRDDRNFAEWCVANGIGVGGPDMLPGPPVFAYESNGQLAFRGAGANATTAGWGGTWDFGTTPLNGQVPNFLQRQVLWGPTDAQYAAYAQSVKCTHLAWAEDGSSLASTVAAATAYPLWSGCPGAYGGMCSMA